MARASGADRLVLVGRVIDAYGVRGWVKLRSFTDPAENLARYKPWLLRRSEETSTVTPLQCRRQGLNLVAHFTGVDDRDVALTFRGADIYVQRSQLPELPEGEYYWFDLLGLTVNTVAGQPLGTITRVMETGSNDVLVVAGERERLIPFLRDSVIVAVDLADSTVTVDWDPEF